MSAFEIVVADVLSYLFSCLPTVFIIGHFEFRVDRSEATFHESVVVTIPRPTHALNSSSATQNGSLFVAGILTAAVAVMDQSGLRLSFFNGQT
jgi:hypothetical protein